MRATVTITAIPLAAGMARTTVGGLSIRVEPRFGKNPVVYAETVVTNTGQVPVKTANLELSTVNY